MLDFQISQYGFRFGLAEGTEPHQVAPGTLTTAENIVWKKSGRAEKRLGTSLLSTSLLAGGSISAATRLFCRGPELCLVDGSNLYAYSPVLAKWKTVDTVPTAGLTWTTALDATTGVMAIDEAISAAGLTVVAWIVGDPAFASYGATGAVRYMVRGSSGEVLIPATDANSGTNHLVRVLTIGTTAYIFSQNTTNLIATTINLSTMAVTTFGTVISNVKVQGWDACIIGSNIVFAYEDTGGGLKLKSVNSSLTGVATGSISSEAGTSINCISIDGLTGESLYVAYYAASSGLVRIACADNATLTQTVAPVTLETLAGVGKVAMKVGVTRYNTTSSLVAWSAFGSGTTTASARTTSVKFNLAGTIDTSVSGRTWGPNLLTRPFMLGGGCYALACDRPTNAGASGTHTVLLRLDAGTSSTFPHRYIGKTELLVGGFTVAGSLARSAAVSSTAVQVPAPFLSANNTSGTVFRQGIRIVTVSVGASLPADTWRTVTYGDEAYLSAGVLCAYDGVRVFDFGFEREPLNIVKSTGAGSVLAGTYLYSWVREFRSAAGMLHRSPAAIVLTAVLGSSLDVTLTQLTGGISNKQTFSTLSGSTSTSPVLVANYRSTAGGVNLQRLTVDPTYNVTLTDSTAPEEVFVDNDPDSDIGNTQTLASRPVLYTTGGILDDFQPVGGVTLCYHVDRLWVLAGDQKTWWYSKAFQDDLGTAPGFHPSLRISFADTQVAMASMDDKAVFFSATGIKYMLGTGPAPTGLNSDFQTPTTIQSDVGCTNPRSVVGTPDGVMFLSDRGLYLLDRNLNLQWIGRPVKDTLAAFPNVTSAVLVAKQNQVRFTCNNTGGTAGCTLVYDYVERQWSTFRHAQGVAGANGAAIADACMWNGAWTFVTPAGQVYTEDISSSPSYLDGGGWVPITLETAWISGPQNSLSPSAGPLKFQSVRTFALNGTSHTDFDLSVQVGFDSNTTYQQTALFAATSAAVAVADLMECNVVIGTRRKCGSIRFKITDASPTAGTLGTGQGPSFDLMALEVGNKRGLTSTPAAKRA